MTRLGRSSSRSEFNHRRHIRLRLCTYSLAMLLACPTLVHAQSLTRELPRSSGSRLTVAWHPARQGWDLGPGDPEHVGMWGFLSGALIGGGAGYAFGRSNCDAVPRGSCVRNNTIGGVVIGGLVGYGLERLFRWR